MTTSDRIHFASAGAVRTRPPALCQFCGTRANTSSPNICKSADESRNCAWMDPPRFPKTYCSQCGGEFGPGNEGYSHCQDHQTVRTNRPARKSTGSSLEQKYVIAREYRGLAPTYTVVFQVRENLSHHETEAEARAAIRRYEEADARRRS